MKNKTIKNFKLINKNIESEEYLKNKNNQNTILYGPHQSGKTFYHIMPDTIQAIENNFNIIFIESDFTLLLDFLLYYLKKYNYKIIIISPQQYIDDLFIYLLEMNFISSTNSNYLEFFKSNNIVHFQNTQMINTIHEKTFVFYFDQKNINKNIPHIRINDITDLINKINSNKIILYTDNLLNSDFYLKKILSLSNSIKIYIGLINLQLIDDINNNFIIKFLNNQIINDFFFLSKKIYNCTGNLYLNDSVDIFLSSLKEDYNIYDIIYYKNNLYIFHKKTYGDLLY